MHARPEVSGGEAFARSELCERGRERGRAREAAVRARDDDDGRVE